MSLYAERMMVRMKNNIEPKKKKKVEAMHKHNVWRLSKLAKKNIHYTPIVGIAGQAFISLLLSAVNSSSALAFFV